MNFLIQLFCLALSAQATTISHSAQEITYSYSAEFRSLRHGNLTQKEVKALAHWHAEHLFGIFHSPEYAGKFGIPSDLNDGHTGTTHPEIVSAESFSVSDDSYTWIKYKAKAKAVTHNEVLKGWLGNNNSATISLPLLANMPLVYSDDADAYANRKWKKCTDSHYSSPIDFSYFYNPFLCEELGSAPIANDIDFKIKLVNTGSAENTKVPLEKIHAANGNGKLVTLYFAFGFDETPEFGSDPAQIHKDYGWKLYSALAKNMVDEYGFTQIESEEQLRTALGSEARNLDLVSPVNLESDTQRRYFNTFVKVDGDLIYVVRSGLFNATNENSSRPLKSFPKFWKEAWENGDFIYYGGHSGDGVSLSLNTIQNISSKIDLDKIRFPRGKTQIAFFDACSSYAHYTDVYSEKNKNAHIISQGLVSNFHLAQPTLNTIVPVLFETREPKWVDLLETVEKNSLLPQVQFLWGKEEGNRLFKKYSRKGQFPSSLMNVWVP